MSVIVSGYEEEAKSYDTERFGSAGGQLINKIQLEIVRKLVEPEGKKILDVACGTGRFTSDLFEHGADIIGIDAAENMLKVARKKNPKIKFESGDIFNLRYKGKTFDVVTGLKIIMHLSEYKKVIKEMIRVAKDDGLIVFEIPNRTCIWSLLMNVRKRVFYKAEHEHKIKKPSFTYSSIKKDLAGMGLKIDKSVGMFYLPETLFRKSPRLVLPIFYRIERFLQFLPARWGENVYLKVVKCGKT